MKTETGLGGKPCRDLKILKIFALGLTATEILGSIGEVSNRWCDTNSI